MHTGLVSGHGLVQCPYIMVWGLLPSVPGAPSSASFLTFFNFSKHRSPSGRAVSPGGLSRNLEWGLGQSSIRPVATEPASFCQS